MRLTPRAGVDRVDGVVEGVLRCRVTAPPADGAANAALIRLLADELHVPRSGIRVVGGIAARMKRLEIDGADRAALVARWPDLAV